MRANMNYLSRLIHSWRIPASGALAILTHWLVEAGVEAGSARGPLLLLSIFAIPFITNTFAGRRGALRAAAVNGAFLTLSITSFVAGRDFFVRKGDIAEFVTVLAFGLACGAFASGFYRRLGRRLRSNSN